MPELTTRRSEPGQLYLWCLRLLALVALASCGYLLYLSVAQRSVEGCGGDSGFDCDSILLTRWSLWMGLPVSFGAILVYGGIFFMSGLVGQSSLRRHKRMAWLIVASCALVGFGAALWFVGLLVTLWVVDSLPFKLELPLLFFGVVHGCGLLIGLLVWWRVPVGPRHVGAGQLPIVSRSHLVRSGGIGLLILVLLPLGQYLLDADKVQPLPERPSTVLDSSSEGQFEVEDLEGSWAGTELVKQINEPEAEEPAPEPEVEPEPPGPPMLTLFAGEYEINLEEVPIIGNLEAKQLLVNLYDYTCRYCRDLDRVMEKFPSRYGGQVAVIMAPVPLESRCNHFVKSTKKRHVNACKYASLALSVWRVEHHAFKKFHRWLFTPKILPKLSDAREYAMRLVGDERLKEGLRDPWVEERLKENAKLYGLAHQGILPKLIIGTRVYTPSPTYAIYAYLEKSLNVRKISP